MENQLTGLVITTLLFLLLTGCREKEQAQINIHLVGDSTMADKPQPEQNPERGWGQMLHLFFNGKVTILNHAVNGRSTRSFMQEGRWTEVVKALCPGDYIFIQFGHNDQKAYDPDRYSNPYSSYRRNLEKMVKESREMGASPVIISSIVRRKFNEHGTLEDSHGAYPFVARQVAESLNVPFIDLQQQSEDLVSGLGPERSAALFMILQPGESEMYPEGKTDNTHLNIAGATELARMVASSISQQKIPLKAYLEPSLSTPRILLITGGHSFDTTEFYSTFKQMEGISFDTISHPYALGLLTSEHIFSYDVLLFYDYQPDLQKKDSSIFRNLALHGMPMLFMHHAICSYQQWVGFQKMLGGQYIMDGYGADPSALSAYRHDVDISVLVADKIHPVTKGLVDFEIRDEGYSNVLMEEGITPLLLTSHPASSSPLAWINEYDGSTVIGLMLGHDLHAYSNPSFQQFVTNALIWLAE